MAWNLVQCTVAAVTLVLVFCPLVLIQAHTVRVCWVNGVNNPGETIIYFGSYHDISENGIVGGIIINGVRFDFTHAVLPSEMDGGVECYDRSSTLTMCSYQISEVLYYQYRVFQDLLPGAYTLTSTSDTVVEQVHLAIFFFFFLSLRSVHKLNSTFVGLKGIFVLTTKRTVAPARTHNI